MKPTLTPPQKGRLLFALRTLKDAHPIECTTVIEKIDRTIESIRGDRTLGKSEISKILLAIAYRQNKILEVAGEPLRESDEALWNLYEELRVMFNS